VVAFLALLDEPELDEGRLSVRLNDDEREERLSEWRE
jgi:hypothetical protein